MRISVAKLRGRIVEVFGTIEAFSEKAECSRALISSYLNHRSYLNQTTILKWARLLRIKDAEIPTYFFSVEVDETERED
mgnify:CR=1 FL=1